MNKIPNRKAICDVLLKEAETDKDIVVLCSDSRGSASLAPFADAYPEQFVEMGIAEQDLVSVSAGLAHCGKKAFAASPACFLSTRSYEQCKIDVAYSNTNVKLIGISGGISYGALGMSHHSAQDIAAMSAIPNMRVYLPSDRFQTAKLVEALLKDEKPAYIRVGRNPVEDIYTEGHVLGGPFYYIENGMGKQWRWLAKIFAFFGAGVGLFGIGTFTQVNGIASAVTNFFDPDKAHTVALFGNTYSWATVVACLVLTVCVGLVVLGGIQRIAKVSQVVVPFMAVLYVALALIIVITNITAVPAAIVTIVKSAFTGSALAGGAMGTMVVAMQKGIARGIFSNESGLGSAPIAAAAAQTKEPVRQGLVSMTGTFIDTIVICTMTGLSIVITETWNTGLEGVAITTAAFQKGLPFPPVVASFSLMLCLVFFAFTTILGWDYYGERCLEYLFNRNKAAVTTYRWLYIICVFIGPYMTVAAVWNIADIFNALMAFPNLIALLALSGVVVKETKDFFKRHKNYEF